MLNGYILLQSELPVTSCSHALLVHQDSLHKAPYNKLVGVPGLKDRSVL